MKRGKKIVSLIVMGIVLLLTSPVAFAASTINVIGDDGVPDGGNQSPVTMTLTGDTDAAAVNVTGGAGSPGDVAGTTPANGGDAFFIIQAGSLAVQGNTTLTGGAGGHSNTWDPGGTLALLL